MEYIDGVYHALRNISPFSDQGPEGQLFQLVGIS